MTPVKYKRDIQHVSGILIIMQKWENNGTEEIGLVTPTPVQQDWLVGGFYMARFSP